MARKAIPIEIKRQLLHESGYRCANPVCRMIIAIDLHHLDQVSEGGENTPENLIALCPNCHRLHHKRVISKESLRAWKLILLSINEAFDRRSVDILLMLSQIPKITLRGEGILEISSLISSNLVFWHQMHTDSFDITLSEKGRIFVDAWKNGELEKALEANTRKST